MTNKEKANYIKLGIMVVFTVLITLVITNLYRSYEENKGKTSYISKYVSTINCNELESAMLEMSDSFIYLSYTGNSNIYDFEKKLSKSLKKYELEDNFLYVDCTGEVDSNGHVKSLSEILSVNNRELVLPAIVYFKDSKPLDYVDSVNGLISIGDFSQILDKFELGDKE